MYSRQKIIDRGYETDRHLVTTIQRENCLKIKLNIFVSFFLKSIQAQKHFGLIIYLFLTCDHTQ